MNFKEINEEENLAMKIMNCPLLKFAVKDPGHCCHEVATWQQNKMPVLLNLSTYEGSTAHRPEPWAGNLAEAKILFIGSNPSFGFDEDYPDWTPRWSEQKLKDFGARRFEASKERPYGATDGPLDSDKDKFYDRSGKIDESAGRIKHWRTVRDWASAIIEPGQREVFASRDYAMTELVHCKSQKEAGVNSALQTCANEYLADIIGLTSAKLIFVLGVTPGKFIAEQFSNIPTHWGSWADKGIYRGNWPRSNSDLAQKRAIGSWSVKDQLMHTVEVVIPKSGVPKTLVWFPRPGLPPVPKSMTGPTRVVDEETLEYWRSKL